MSLTPTTLTPTADPAVFTVPEDYVAGTLAVLVAGVVQEPGVTYDAAGTGNRTVTFAVAPSGWVAGTWVTAAGLGVGTYLTAEVLQARVGGPVRYLQLTDDDRDGTADPAVENLVLAQVDLIVDGYARRGGYTVPLASTDIVTILPFLADIGNYRLVTRGGRQASDDDRTLHDGALAMLEKIATGDFKLPSYQTAAPIAEFGFVSGESPSGSGADISLDRDTLVGY
jgi:phage gp36-like protein